MYFAYMAAFLPMSWASFFILSLTLFRFKLDKYAIPITVSSFLVAGLSMIIQYHNVAYLTAILQPILIMCLLHIVFKQKLLHAMFIAVTVYCYNMLSETVYNGITAWFDYELYIKGLREKVIAPIFFITAVNLMTSAILVFKRIGFTFISEHDELNPNTYLFNSPRKTFYVMFFVLIFLGFISYSIYHLPSAVMIFELLVILSLTYLLELSYRKELSQNNF